MKRKLLITGAVVVLLTASFLAYKVTAFEAREDYFVTEGYSIKVFRNAQLQFPIYFKGLKTDISFDERNPEKSTIVATIDARTVDTGNELMTVHAKEEGILHTDKFPEIKFQSSAVRKTSSGYEVTGNLTMKGITKAITFPFTFGNQIFKGEFSITAKDFNKVNSASPQRILILTVKTQCRLVRSGLS
jgi:polyisoprenoid-binding protein YceI